MTTAIPKTTAVKSIDLGSIIIYASNKLIEMYKQSIP